MITVLAFPAAYEEDPFDDISNAGYAPSHKQGSFRADLRTLWQAVCESEVRAARNQGGK